MREVLPLRYYILAVKKREEALRLGNLKPGEGTAEDQEKGTNDMFYAREQPAS